MNTYRELIAVDVPTRAAAGLAGVSRATATRKPRVPLPVAAPAIAGSGKYPSSSTTKRVSPAKNRINWRRLRSMARLVTCVSRSGRVGLFLAGHRPVISNSSEKLKNVRMRTITASTVTDVGSG